MAFKLRSIVKCAADFKNRAFLDSKYSMAFFLSIDLP